MLIIIALAPSFMGFSQVSAQSNNGCATPTTADWEWVPGEEGSGYWFYDSVIAISFTVPTHIERVDYFVRSSGLSFQAYSGELVEGANTASAFCSQATPAVYTLYLPFVSKPMPTIPAEALCDWPSQNSWNWVNYGSFSAWNIGPLTEAITMTVPDHIKSVSYSLNGVEQPPAHPGDTISLHEATAFCK